MDTKYTLVTLAALRARELTDGMEPLIPDAEGKSRSPWRWKKSITGKLPMNAATENRMQKRTFEGKHVVVGITGGIAAYKAAELVSQLRQRGADVHCIMTEHATKLISPITFGELSGHDVTVDMFANISHWDVQHIALARLADLFIVAPATANISEKWPAALQMTC